MFVFKEKKVFFLSFSNLSGLTLLLALFVANYVTANRTNHPIWKNIAMPQRKIPYNIVNNPDNHSKIEHRSFTTHPTTERNSIHYNGNDSQPSLFWSYYNNAARTMEKVSTEQGLNC